MEFYVKNIGEPNYKPNEMQSDAELELLLTQISTLLFTRKGEVLGDPGFGANLEDYVYELRYNDYQLKTVIDYQLSEYVPLASKYNVDISIEVVDDVSNHIVFLDITVDSRFQLGVYI
jgi:hypothetical protein